MTLIVWRWTVFPAQIVRVYWSIRERNLIVVGIIIRTRQSVRGTKLQAIRKSLFQTQQQPVVIRAHARLQILNYFRTTDDGIKRHSTDNATDDEMRAGVAHVIGPKHELVTKLALHSNIKLMDHRVL